MQVKKSPKALWNAKAIFQLFKDTFAEWSEDKAPRLGAALAYYTVFSLAPLLIIAIAIAGLVFGEEAARHQLDDQIRGLVGQDGAELVQTMVENSRKPQEGLLATGIGVATLLFGALGAFGQLQDALNTIWEVRPKPGRGIRGVLEDRLAPAGLVLGVGFLLLVSLVASAGITAVGTVLTGWLTGFVILVQIINFLISFIVVAVLFAMIFKFLPDAKTAWRDVWLGGALTSLLFNVGKLVIGLYLGSGGVASAYGAAGSLIVILLWVYYSAQILFFGAEFTQVYANQYGSTVRPARNALPVTDDIRAQEGMPRTQDVSAVAKMQPNSAETKHDAYQPPVLRREPGHVLAADGAPEPERDYWGTLAGFMAGVGAGVIMAMQARQEDIPTAAKKLQHRVTGRRPARR